MRAPRLMVFPVVMLGVVCVMASCMTTHYAARSSEEIQGTWVNEKEGMQKIVMLPDGTGHLFIYKSDATPCERFTYRFYRRWMDTDGNVLYTTDYTLGVGSAQQNIQELDRISRDGSVWEYVYEHVGEFSPEKYPARLDPQHPHYHIFYRSQED